MKWAASLEGREPQDPWFKLARCEECALNGRPAIPGSGPIPASLALVGEAPGAGELAEGRPFCLDADTKILYADLTWRRLGDVQVGDQLLAFDEETSPAHGASGRGHRMWRVSTVLEVFHREAFCYELVTPYGNLVATPDHLVLTTLSTKRGMQRWLRVDQLCHHGGEGKRTSSLCFLFPPWDIPSDYNRGWLAGFFDGEGHIRTGRSKRCLKVGFSQNVGQTLREALDRLREAGFDVNNDGSGTYRGNTCVRHVLKGGTLTCLEFLGEVRPSRLLAILQEKLAVSPPAVVGIKAASVLARREAGIRHVVDIKTTTGTFIANGFMVHNCGPAGKLLNHVLEGAGLNREELYVTNSVLCRPPNNATPTPAMIECCRPRLVEELGHVKPKVIVPMGNPAIRAILAIRDGVSKVRGHVFWSDTFKAYVVPTWHPAAILRRPVDYPELEADFKKVKELLDVLEREKSPNRLLARVPDTEVIWCKYPDQALKAIAFLKKQPMISIDVETSSFDPLTSELLSIQCAWTEGRAVVFGRSVLKDPIVKLNLQKLFDPNESGPVLVGWNLKFDLKHLATYLGFFPRTGEDAMLISHLLDERRGTNSLKYVATKEFNVADWEEDLHKFLPTKKTSFAAVPEEVLVKYAGIDADMTFRLYPILKSRAENEGRLLNVYETITKPAVPVLSRIELRGAPISRERLLEMRDKGLKILNELEQELVELAGIKDFNPRSPQQVMNVLYRKLRLPVPRVKDMDKETSNEKALKELAPLHPFPKKLLEYRKVHKLFATYVEGILERLGVDGRIHTEYNLVGTVTGRLASSNPNLQNIPRNRDEDPLHVKDAFLAPPGWVILQADYSQLELRVAALLSKDPFLAQMFREGRDIHGFVASQFYGENYTKEQRVIAKFTVFGTLYGRSASSVAEEHGITVFEAQRIIDTFLGHAEALKKWRDEQFRLACERGWIESWYGRKRRFPIVTESAAHEIRNQSYNFPIQSTASDTCLLALIRLSNLLDPEIAFPILTVHDSIVFQVRDDKVDEVAKVVKETMEAVPFQHEVDFPFTVELEVGPSWGELEELQL